MSVYAIYHDLQINASLHKVFEAVAQPEHLINWWPLKCTGKAKIGEEYNFYFSPEYDWLAEVINCEIDERIHFKMTRSDADWDATSFGYDLSRENGKTKLQFWHVGWPECNDHFRRSSFCWAMLLNGLKKYLEDGVIIPFAERE